MAGTAFSGKRGKLNAAKSLKLPKDSAVQGQPACPNWLSREGAALFSYLARELHALGVIGTLDGQALAKYCQAEHDYIRFTRKINALNAAEEGSGDIQQIGDSYINVSVWHTHRNNAEKRADVLAKQFGLTPLARKAISDLIKPKDEGDVIDQKFFS